jgi:hypothetical protein
MALIKQLTPIIRPQSDSGCISVLLYIGQSFGLSKRHWEGYPAVTIAHAAFPDFIALADAL